MLHFLEHAERALVYALCWAVQLIYSFLVIAKREEEEVVWLDMRSFN